MLYEINKIVQVTCSNRCTFNGNENFTLPNCHGQTKAAYMDVWLQTKSYKKEKEMKEIEKWVYSIVGGV